MDTRHAHLLKLAIAGLNALAMHAEESLFCSSIWLHIGTVDRNHRDHGAGIELMVQRFTDIATITEKYSAKWQGSGQIIDGSGVM